MTLELKMQHLTFNSNKVYIKDDTELTLLWHGQIWSPLYLNGERG